MLSRRRFGLTAAATVFLPSVARARFGDLESAAQSLPQLHSLQVMRGNDIVFAEAPRGPGLNRPANIKSCSKSIVALLLGASIDRGEIASVTGRSIFAALLSTIATTAVLGMVIL